MPNTDPSGHNKSIAAELEAERARVAGAVRSPGLKPEELHAELGRILFSYAGCMNPACNNDPVMVEVQHINLLLAAFRRATPSDEEILKLWETHKRDLCHTVQPGAQFFDMGYAQFHDAIRDLLQPKGGDGDDNAK